jgi:2-keto-4-pentenoate hydratase/2-oxohepta-3-ene-1,7-dioic acid hydratase in catechol pathway
MTPAGPIATMRAALAGRLAVHDPRRPIGADDLFPAEESHTAPRIARFLAGDGSPRIGLVLESVEGLPRRLLDLTARHGLGPGLLGFAGAGGFEIAGRELERDNDTPRADHVTLERHELPERLLSPVDIDAADIEAGARLVVGFGLTFRAHRGETGRARPFAFPKPTAPTGACAAVRAGSDRDGAVGLLDYELELGCVPFRDIDLDRLDTVDAAADFGYLVVNDVSARAPILRDRRKGYAHAKGRPTYLPAGPWLVPGTHFTRDAPRLRRMVLTVTEAKGHDGSHGPHTLRQDARLEDLSLGLDELLRLLSRRRGLSMRGEDGRPWPVTVEREGRRILPAGSLLLTGTPGGTAIRSPRAADQLALVLRSLRYLRWPSEDYRRHLEAHRHAFGFLSPGDRVSGWITGLGRQEWLVR